MCHESEASEGVNMILKKKINQYCYRSQKNASRMLGEVHLLPHKKETLMEMKVMYVQLRDIYQMSRIVN